jgi:hypothetical protein
MFDIFPTGGAYLGEMSDSLVEHLDHWSDQESLKAETEVR